MIGRRGELADLRQRLTGPHRLVTVTGPAGIGKSRLARAAADELHRAFQGGTLVLDLEEAGNRADLLPAVARLLDVGPPVAPDCLAAVVAAIADRHLLLLLDGCDHLVEPCGQLVTTALARCPNLRVLATSRQLLQVEGESVLVLGPLDHPPPGGEPLRAAAAAEHEAVSLFVNRARRSVPSFELDDVNAPAVAAVTAAVGGVPLAVELAAARVRALSPQAILERLTDPYRLLSKGDPDGPERCRSLRHSVSLSAEVCTPAERELWARMSVFAGATGIDAVEAVCSGEGIEVVEVLDLVDGLLEKSVLVRDGSDPSEVRYRLLEPLRAYGAELLGERVGRWQRRHQQWCVELLEEAAAGWFGPEEGGWLSRLRRADTELSATFGQLPEAPGEGAELSRLVAAVAALAPCWAVLDRLAEARRWLAVCAAQADDPAVRVEAELGAGWCAFLQADTAGAVAARARSEPVSPDAPPAVRDLADLLESGVALARGRYAAAGELLEGLARGAGTGAAGTSATALLHLGITRSLGRDPAGAAAALRECLQVTEAAGEQLLRAQCLTVLAAAALAEGEAEVADRAARDALVASVQIGDRAGPHARTGVPFLLGLLGCVAAQEGQPERAATLLGAAESRRGLPCPPVLRARAESLRRSATGRARSALGEQGLGARRRLGEDLSIEQAVRFALERTLDPPEQPSEQPSEAETPLSAREREVAGLVADGLSNREIAERLVISTRTVQGHVENILRKLGFSSRAQVAAWVAARTTDHRGA